MKSFFGLAGALFAVWLLLSGMYTPFLLAAGAVASLAAATFAARMEGAREEPWSARFLAAPVLYWPWLFKEIAKSGWDVTRVILDPRRASPALARFRASQTTAVGLATHANSITLTPGTLTIEVEGSEFLVHALTREAAGALAGSEMDRRVSRLETGR